jgi:hypothetical protein
VTLWCASWAVAGFLFALDLLPYKPLSWLTAVLICGATVAFSAGALGGERLGSTISLPRSLSGRLGHRERDARALEGAAMLATALMLVMLLAFLLQQTRNFGLHDTLLVSPTARLGLDAGASPVTIKYVYAAIAAAGLAGIVAGRAKTAVARRRWLIIAAVNVASVYFSTGRSTIVIVAAIATFGYWLGKERLPSTRILIAGAAGLGVLALTALIAIGEIQGKTFENSALRTLPSAFTEHAALRPLALPYEYASASFGALNEQVAVSTIWGESDGCATASAVCSGLEHLGVPDIEPRPLIRPFTALPLRWNLYTALDLPLLDGGRALALPILALTGALFGMLWSFRRSLFGSVAYAIAAPTLLFSANQFGFTAPHILGGVLIALALVAFCWGVERVRRPVESRPVAA